MIKRKRKNNNLREIVKFSAVFFIYAVVLASCKKEDQEVGLNIQPQEDQLNVEIRDTVTVLPYTVETDSFRSSDRFNNLVGSYLDPIFGLVTTNFYTQLRLTTNGPIFGGGDMNNITVDSVVLSLVYSDSAGYSSVYGKQTPITFEVYKLTDVMDVEADYYSNQKLPLESANLVLPGFETITPNPNSNIILGEDTLVPHLRIPLLNSLGEEILSQSGTGNLDDNIAFTNFFSGLSIKTNNTSHASGDGSIVSFNVAQSQTRVTVYYRDDSEAQTDTTSYVLQINPNCARYTEYEFDYAGTPVEQILQDSTNALQSYYLQVGAGLHSIIQFPFLDSLKDQNIVINHAELVIPVSESSDFSPVQSFFIFNINENGSLQEIDDYVTSTSYQTVVYDNTKNEYRVVLTRYIQQVLSGQLPSAGIEFLPENGRLSPNRSVLLGPENTSAKTKLVLTYTKY